MNHFKVISLQFCSSIWPTNFKLSFTYQINGRIATLNHLKESVCENQTVHENFAIYFFKLLVIFDRCDGEKKFLCNQEFLLVLDKMRKLHNSPDLKITNTHNLIQFLKVVDTYSNIYYRFCNKNKTCYFIWNGKKVSDSQA